MIRGNLRWWHNYLLNGHFIVGRNGSASNSEGSRGDGKDKNNWIIQFWQKSVSSQSSGKALYPAGTKAVKFKLQLLSLKRCGLTLCAPGKSGTDIRLSNAISVVAFLHGCNSSSEFHNDHSNREGVTAKSMMVPIAENKHPRQTYSCLAGIKTLS